MKFVNAIRIPLDGIHVPMALACKAQVRDGYNLHEQ